MRPPRASPPHIIALTLFLASYLFTIHQFRRISARDPSSLFFDPSHAFERNYSLLREAQAAQWIRNLGERSEDEASTKASPSPTFCIGIATVHRAGEGSHYFARAVGSLLSNLTAEERRDVHLVTFFADLDPHVHEALAAPWLPRVADGIMTYNEAPPEVLERMRDVASKDKAFDYKPLFDYKNLLQFCQQTHAPYVLIMEDDTIAAADWLGKTKAALEELETEHAFSEKAVYLRLFYNERILGWNSEEWPRYLFHSILVEGAIYILLQISPRLSQTFSRFLTPLTNRTILLILCPASILLFFAAGRLTVSPIPAGVHRMEKYGCCSQAFVFPTTRIPALLEFFDSWAGKVDILTEFFADKQGWQRWALSPSVFAHVGSKSSKGSHVTQWGRSDVENIWNFGFERLGDAVGEG